MSQSIAKQNRNAAYKVVLFQLAISAVLGLLGLIWSLQIAFSLFIGSLIVVVANFIFATIVFRQSGAKALLAIKKAFYIGESVKFMLTLLMLVLAFTLLPVEPAALLIGFSVAVLSQWFTPLIFKPSF